MSSTRPSRKNTKAPKAEVSYNSLHNCSFPTSWYVLSGAARTPKPQTQKLVAIVFTTAASQCSTNVNRAISPRGDLLVFTARFPQENTSTNTLPDTMHNFVCCPQDWL
ncbi:hypothetical protein J6590_015732 [Homalodisca vitripennis]|nr:hypothetical protein J6590_015732 [Homalodisca vitripennis]